MRALGSLLGITESTHLLFLVLFVFCQGLCCGSAQPGAVKGPPGSDTARTTLVGFDIPATDVAVFDRVLPPRLLTRFEREVNFLHELVPTVPACPKSAEDHHITHPTNTYWIRRDANPETVVEAVALRLAATAAPDDSWIGAEFWLQKRGVTADMHLHFDHDEGRTHVPPLLFPMRSTVFYLGDVGGPTVVLNQTLEGKSPPNNYFLHPANAEDAHLVYPRRNRFVMFPGRNLHGVLPGPATFSVSSPRVTFLVNVWGHRIHIPSSLTFPSVAYGPRRVASVSQNVRECNPKQSFQPPSCPAQDWRAYVGLYLSRARSNYGKVCSVCVCLQAYRDVVTRMFSLRYKARPRPLMYSLKSFSLTHEQRALPHDIAAYEKNAPFSTRTLKGGIGQPPHTDVSWSFDIRFPSPSTLPSASGVSRIQYVRPAPTPPGHVYTDDDVLL